MKRIIATLATLMALVSILIVPSVARADSGSGNTVIDGTVASTITVTAPGAFGLGTLTPGQTITSTPEKTVNVATNLPTWTLTAAELGTGADGQMAKGTTALGNPLNIKGGSQTSYVSLATPVTLKTGGAGGGGVTDVSFQQIVPASPAPGTYSITVVFTASGTP